MLLAAELGVTAGHGHIIEEDAAVRVATRRGDVLIEQEPAAGVGPALDHEQGRARRQGIHRALMRRGELARDTGTTEAEPVIQRGDLLLDPARHQCSWRSENVDLTVTEFLILKSLALRPGHVKSRDQLMDGAYGEHIYVDDRTIDSHIKRLRKKFKAVDGEFAQIETLYGVGYRYRDR